VHLDTLYVIHGREYSILLVKTVNKPGVLSRIADVIADMNINIAKISTLEPVEGPEAFILFLLECDQETLLKVKERIKNELSSIVKSISAVGARDSYVFLPFNHIVFGDRRALVLTQGMLRELIREVMRRYGPLPHVENILRSIGRAIGKQLFKGWISYLETDHGRDWESYINTALQHFADIFHALGYGSIEIEQVGVATYRIIVYDNIECRAARELKYQGKTGYITAGVIAGFLEALLSREVSVEEVECINDGSDKDVFEAHLKGIKPVERV
jgi:predicted hydrocarbon binding protein/predicted amino acid-binding ACT domain protein